MSLVSNQTGNDTAAQQAHLHLHQDQGMTRTKTMPLPRRSKVVIAAESPDLERRQGGYVHEEDGGSDSTSGEEDGLRRNTVSFASLADLTAKDGHHVDSHITFPLERCMSHSSLLNSAKLITAKSPVGYGAIEIEHGPKSGRVQGQDAQYLSDRRDGGSSSSITSSVADDGDGDGDGDGDDGCFSCFDPIWWCLGFKKEHGYGYTDLGDDDGHEPDYDHDFTTTHAPFPDMMPTHVSGSGNKKQSKARRKLDFGGSQFQREEDPARGNSHEFGTPTSPTRGETPDQDNSESEYASPPHLQRTAKVGTRLAFE